MVPTPTRNVPGAAEAVAPGTIGAATRPRFVTARIAELQWLGADILRVFLELPESADFVYAPGQYLTIAWDDAWTRCFSMASPLAGAVIELHIQHWPEGRFSGWLARQAKIGDTLRIAGPYGNFLWRSQKSASVIMLATGTGIAPILAMLTSAFRRGTSHLPIRLYWGMREHCELYREPLLRHWEALHPNFRFTPVLSVNTSDRVQDVAQRDAQDLRGADVYACGAPRMVEDARAKFVARADMCEDRFFSDAFAHEEEAPAAPSIVTPSITVTVTGAQPRRVEVKRGETLMQALC